MKYNKSMKFYVLIILCIVQGLTEFLPVSSSGHLMLIEEIFGVTENILLINLFLHLATLFAVVCVYRNVLFNLIKKPFQPLMYKLIITTLITVVFAGVYEIFNLNNILGQFYGYYFLVTAVILFICYLFQKKSVIVKVGEVSYKSSVVVGLVQGVAVLPGISRSGTTISALMFLGNDESKSSEYSFLMSIPIILGGFIFEVLKVDNWNNIFMMVNWWQVLISFVLTFLISIASIKLTIKLLKNNKFIYFSIYLLLIGRTIIFFI